MWNNIWPLTLPQAPCKFEVCLCTISKHDTFLKIFLFGITLNSVLNLCIFAAYTVAQL